MAYQEGIHVESCNFVTGDLIDGRWQVDAFLGEGSFGQVFRVRDHAGPNLYALKLLKLWTIALHEREHLLNRFNREYETGLIDSPYLVHSLCKGMVRGNAYMVMEYCQGGDLETALKRNTRLDLSQIAVNILLGLRDLHVNGKVHRDLKPENVLLRGQNHAVLTDFGISGDRNNRLTRRGWEGVPQQRFGTIAYMPPEQMNPPKGNATVLPTTDIFSFGVLMYKIMTGRLPFGDLDNNGDVPRYVANGMEGEWDRARLLHQPGCRDWLPLIEGCLQPDFTKRFQSIDEVLRFIPGKKEHWDIPATTPYKPDLRGGMLLRVMQGEEPGRSYHLDSLFVNNSSIIYIGRDGNEVWNHIGLKEEESCYISRRHCTIEKDTATGHWTIRDGQFRVECPIGLREATTSPCLTCSAICRPGDRRHNWIESMNGTYVNSNEVTPSGIRIKAGDIISIGDVKMRVEGV